MEDHDAPTEPKGAEVLIGDDGVPMWDRVAALVAEQDAREVTISE